MSSSTENGGYDACLDAMLLSCGQVYPAVLNAAIELNLFEIIAKGSPEGMSPSDIASELPNRHPDIVHRLDRVLFFLTTYSLLTCSSRKVYQDGRVERFYSLSPTNGKYLFTDDDGASYAALLKLNCHPISAKLFQNFKQVILDDEENLFKKVHGIPMFEYMETDPTFKPLFHKAMAGTSTMDIRQILETYKGFEGISTLVDVGGGIGQSLKMIISKYPSIKGINFDLPQVVQHAPSHPGMKHVGGDMFKNVPEGDTIMLKAILHNWPDEKCIQILKNCHRSLKKNGKVIIIDVIMPEIPRATSRHKHASVLDALMFLQSGGKERTEKEFEALCEGAGFSRCQIACSAFSSSLGVIEFYG